MPSGVTVARDDAVEIRSLEWDDTLGLPLGTPYPLDAKHLGALREAVPNPLELVIDATGVGRPVLDLLRQAGHLPVAVSIIGAGSERLDPEDLIWRVPKHRLLAPLGPGYGGAATEHRSRSL